MRRHLTLLLITTLAWISLGSAHADGEPATDSVAAPSLLAGSSITCSSAWPSGTLGCWLERPLLVVGDVELAVGVDAQAVLTGGLEDAHLAPYLIAAVYAEAWSAWLEVRLPELAGVPILGDSDWLRVGVSLRVPP